MSTYTIAIKHNDDTMHPQPRFQNLDRDSAEEIMEDIWTSRVPFGHWAGVVVLDDTGNIYSEMEW